jgi:ABC-type Fe3+-hydroxamate transport system substrate-binding protein
MNRADPFFERDATGWQFIDVHSGNVNLEYVLANNPNRKVIFDEKKGHPVDAEFQNNPSLPQKHY